MQLLTFASMTLLSGDWYSMRLEPIASLEGCYIYSIDFYFISYSQMTSLYLYLAYWMDIDWHWLLLIFYQHLSTYTLEMILGHLYSLWATEFYWHIFFFCHHIFIPLYTCVSFMINGMRKERNEKRKKKKGMKKEKKGRKKSFVESERWMTCFWFKKKYDIKRLKTMQVKEKKRNEKKRTIGNLKRNGNLKGR